MVNIKDKGDPICALVNITQNKTKTMKRKKINMIFWNERRLESTWWKLIRKTDAKWSIMRHILVKKGL